MPSLDERWSSNVYSSQRDALPRQRMRAKNHVPALPPANVTRLNGVGRNVLAVKYLEAASVADELAGDAHAGVAILRCAGESSDAAAALAWSRRS